LFPLLFFSLSTSTEGRADSSENKVLTNFIGLWLGNMVRFGLVLVLGLVLGLFVTAHAAYIITQSVSPLTSCWLLTGSQHMLSASPSAAAHALKCGRQPRPS